MGETYARFRTCRTACCGDDRFTHDYDEILYHDSTRNMTENVSELQMMIQQGDTEHLSAWLNEVISEETVPQEIQRAKELFEKLAEYKPLAKIDEVEEQNYNMIDNVLNNGAEKAQREENKKEQEQSVEKVSLKLLSNRRLSQVISADYLRRKYLSQSAVNEPKAFYIGWHRRLSRAYFSSGMAGLK